MELHLLNVLLNLYGMKYFFKTQTCKCAVSLNKSIFLQSKTLKLQKFYTPWPPKMVGACAW